MRSQLASSSISNNAYPDRPEVRAQGRVQRFRVEGCEGSGSRLGTGGNQGGSSARGEAYAQVEASKQHIVMKGQEIDTEKG
eukprot:1854463-Rhodomonas_salina.2